MYYRASRKALKNKQDYHLAAILIRNGKPIKIGENTDKTHPKFKRQYPDGEWAAHMHAEMNVLRFSRPGDEVEVIRVTKTGESFTMAKPCKMCQAALRKHGIKKVRYTNWDGEWEELCL